MFEKELEKKDSLSAYLVGINRREFRPGEAEEHLDELASLAQTMGVEILGRETASANRPNAAFLLGSGKVEEIRAAAEALESNLIIVDDDLTPAQQRNWEKTTKNTVIDRREVILEIFAQRAQTKEARLQVELAKLEYSLPRLKRAWAHLERQRGGGGFIGGAGEAQIEIDRRLVRDSIAQHKRELTVVRQQRATQRKGRRARPVPTAALVGYTNSGKSSLLNRLTHAEVLEENKLFATLDPTTRRIELPNSQQLLLTDTVGFIRKLPHMLVDAFMATLEEARVGDFLVHVIDASHPAAREHIQATDEVLKELGIEEKSMLFVFNKSDLVEDPLALAELRNTIKGRSVVTSTHSGEGLEELRSALADLASEGMEHLTLRIPPAKSELVSFAYREGRVISRGWDGDITVLEVDLPPKRRSALEPYIVPNGDGAEGETG